MTHAATFVDARPICSRLETLAALDPDDLSLIDSAISGARPVVARSELVREGDLLPSPMLLVFGWAAHVRQLKDGRRQILSLILPGELVAVCPLRNSRAASTVIALTDLSMARLPRRSDVSSDSGLLTVYDATIALEEHQLLAQITRLGRLNAYERIADLLIELQARLEVSGLTRDGHFRMPLTQDFLADLLGLTSVHVNRTLQTMRREDVLTLRSSNVELHDREGLARLVDYRPSRLLN